MSSKISNYTILIVDDEDIMRNGLVEPLGALGYEIAGVASAEDAIRVMTERKINILITDMRLPKMSGMELLTSVLEKYPDTAVMVMTAYGTVDTAVEAMKKGAFDYITKPFTLDEIQVAIEKMSERLDLLFENEKLKTELRGRHGVNNIIGKSSKMGVIFDLIEKVAPSNATVIIYGESGTGKELVAAAIHYAGNRSSKPYVKLNCAALPETLLESELFGYEKGAFTGAVTRKPGKFESADNGTIFLDEIGDIVPEIQVKLLRVLQEKEFMRVGGVNPVKVDVRIICATNANLQKKVAEGKFREDLYYRLNVIPIYIPALRERKEDIPLLINHFIAKFNKENGRGFKKIHDDALRTFFNYSWPGNVRQLENTIERIVVLNDAEIMTRDMIPMDLMAEFKKDGESAQSFEASKIIEGQFGKTPPAPAAVTNTMSTANGTENGEQHLCAPILSRLSEIERLHIIRVLDKLEWNLSKTARILDIDRKTLYLKIEKYGIKKIEP